MVKNVLSDEAVPFLCMLEKKVEQSANFRCASLKKQFDYQWSISFLKSPAQLFLRLHCDPGLCMLFFYPKPNNHLVFLLAPEVNLTIYIFDANKRKNLKLVNCIVWWQTY